MKILNCIFSLLITALMLTAFVPVSIADATDEELAVYTSAFENNPAQAFSSDNSAQSTISFFADTVFEGCYGNQLTGVAEELYDSMVKHFIADNKTNEYVYTFKTPFIFEAEISGGHILMNEELEEIDLILDYAIQVAMDAFLYDHPEVYWLQVIGSSYGVYASGNSVNGYTGVVSSITIIPYEIYNGASSKLAAYNNAVDAAVKKIAVSDSRYNTLKSVHDYICNNAHYNSVKDARVHSSEPLFIGNGGLVCDGYAKSFKVLCDKLGIPCVLVSGYANGSHMWNYVKMDDGKWYLIDTTWDDQEEKVYDTYFLANANTVGFEGLTVNKERRENTDFSGRGYISFIYPELSTTSYTTHTHKWESVYTVDIMPTCIKKGSKSIHCCICDATKGVTDIPAIGHSFTTYIYDNNATYAADGTKTAKCNNSCGAEDSVSVSGTRLVLGKSSKIKTVSKANSVTLTWEKVEGATGYRVFVAENGAWKQVKKATNALTFTHTGLNQGTKYNYAVRAYVNTGKKIIWAPKYAVVKTATTPAVTTAFEAAAQSTDYITLTWNKVTGATGYRIFLYNTSIKKWDIVLKSTSKITATIKNLTANKTYIFAVRPYINTGTQIVWAPTYQKLTTCTAPATPTIRLATTAVGRATMAWNNVDGETGYQVYYSTNSASGFKKVSNYGADVIKAFKTDLTSGQTYYFKVRAYKAYNGKYIYSPFSEVKSVVIK